MLSADWSKQEAGALSAGADKLRTDAARLRAPTPEPFLSAPTPKPFNPPHKKKKENKKSKPEEHDVCRAREELGKLRAQFVDKTPRADLLTAQAEPYTLKPTPYT